MRPSRLFPNRVFSKAMIPARSLVMHQVDEIGAGSGGFFGRHHAHVIIGGVRYAKRYAGMLESLSLHFS